MNSKPGAHQLVSCGQVRDRPRPAAPPCRPPLLELAAAQTRPYYDRDADASDADRYYAGVPVARLADPVSSPAAVWHANAGVCLLGGRTTRGVIDKVTCLP
jgi:hypothetical protein